MSITKSLVLGLLLLVAFSASGTDIVIVNKDGPGEGLNDGTPRTAVGGNPGDTLGQQRMNVLQYAAQIMASRLRSAVTIRIAVEFRPMTCSANRSVIGSAGTSYLVSGFAGGKADTLYPIALANALAGQRLDVGHSPYADIRATFNSALDDPQYKHCLAGGSWYYGLDGNTPSGELSFLNAVIHELIHGLGFQSFVNTQTGAFQVSSDGRRMADVYSVHVKDLALPGQPRWPGMTAAERQRSATHTGDLVWAALGNSTTANAVAGLGPGSSRAGQVKLYAPAVLAPRSSVSHFSDAVVPDQIMGPFTNDSNVLQGLGLSVCILRDIGWRLDSGVRCPDRDRVLDFDSAADSAGAGHADASRDAAPGGGCSINKQAAFDPLFAAMVLVALGVLGWRRRTNIGA